MPYGPHASGLPASGLPAAARVRRQLQRAHDVQQANLLARLHSERLHALSAKVLVLVGAERQLREARAGR